MSPMLAQFSPGADIGLRQQFDDTDLARGA